MNINKYKYKKKFIIYTIYNIQFIDLFLNNSFVYHLY